MHTQQARTLRALNVLTKWRTLFAGWQLGTRPDDDQVAAAVRDHREATLVLRAEMSALTHLLLRKSVFTEAEHLQALQVAAEQLNEDLAARFPGIKATEYGLQMNMLQAAETMKGWPQ